MKRTSRSFEIALSAVACAVASLALTLGSYVDIFLFAGYLLAVFALMLPLSKRFYWGFILAFLGSVLLAFFFCGLAILYLVPFAVFFGLHPFANELQLRFVHKRPVHVLCFFGKALWFDLAMWLSWTLVFVPLLGADQMSWYPFVMQYFYYVLFLGGTAAFALYDFLIFLCRRSVDRAVRRIGR